ncbi:MAG: lipid-A-disaccharide synthase, partial [Bacteroidales bacterium]|nr:lipid-A-disaccharide synthase [Bacteroidales bacterium]
IRRDVDELFSILPFEVDFFRRHNYRIRYVGNPTVDEVTAFKADKSRKPVLEDDGRRVIALLAGSRQQEIGRMMPLFAQLEKLISQSQYRDCQLVVAGAPSTDISSYDKYLKDSSIKVLFGETYSLLKNADAAVINSGTASLEGALIGTPQVVAYTMNELSYRLAVALIKLDAISLANIILGRHIFRELIQHECTPENMLKEIDRLISDGQYRQRMLADYYRLRDVLGGEGASERFANAMIDSLRSSR